MIRLVKSFLKWIKSTFSDAPERPQLPVEPQKPTGKSARERLFDAALEIEGKVHEIPGKTNNELIVKMHEIVSGKRHPDEVPWCAAAVGYLLDLIGLPHTKSLLAKSYLNYGKEVDLSEAMEGDIIVLERNGKGWQGHVGIYAGGSSNTVKILGGNQDNSFNRKDYPLGNVLGVRRPVDQSENIAVNKWDDHDLGEYFPSFLDQEVQDLLEVRPSDIKNYCPRYDLIDRKSKMLFWKLFLYFMAKKESGINTDLEFLEPRSLRTSTGRRVISRGLFQLSFESVNGYAKFGGVKLTSPQQLHDPLINLEAAIFILKHWIKRDGVISAPKWKGGARYWSVLRDNTNHEFIKKSCLENFK